MDLEYIKTLMVKIPKNEFFKTQYDLPQKYEEFHYTG